MYYLYDGEDFHGIESGDVFDAGPFKTVKIAEAAAENLWRQHCIQSDIYKVDLIKEMNDIGELE